MDVSWLMDFVVSVNQQLFKRLKNLKMLSPRLSECIECSNISALLCDIDHKLADLAKIQYNNVVFALNKPFPGEVMGDLLNYKRILTYRACNCDYAGCFSVNQISSKIKTLYPGCKCIPKKNPSTTSSTTTSNLTTTSTSTSSTSTSSTSSTSSTTSTSTTRSLLSPGGPYGVINTICLVCLGDTDSPSACANSIFIGDCVSYFYNSSCIPLTVGCTLYTDVNLTTPAIGDPTTYCSDGVNSYQINSSGVILSITPCPAPPVYYSHCSSFVIPKIDGTPFTVGSVTVTCSYTGDVTTFAPTWVVPGTLDVFPANSPWLGKNWNMFSLTFNFSAPVNNVNIYQGGGDLGETYRFTTNAGTVSLVGHYLNNVTITGDTINIDPFIIGGFGNSIVGISNSVPFTTLTISGYTSPTRPINSWGSIFSICTQLV